MRIMSDKNITREEVISLVEAVDQRVAKKVKFLSLVTIASVWVAISTLVVVFLK